MVWQELQGNPVCLAKLVIAMALELPSIAITVTAVAISAML